MIDISTAIISLHPDAEFIIQDNYESIVWLKNKPDPAPSIQDVENEILRLQTEYDSKLYQRQRAPEYPSLQDLADALYWQSKGNTEPMTNYIAACEAVKTKYPKGE